MAEFIAKTAMESIVAKVIKDGAGNAITKRAGYSYINGSLVPNTISTIPARAIRAGRIVRPGVGMTEKFTASIDPKSVNHVTVQLQTNVGVRARSIKGNTNAGTPGNDGLINLNPKIVPSTTPFDIPLLQLEDQPFFFPQMMLETMLFDETVETIANYMDNTVNGIDAYHMAKALSFSMYRGARTRTGSTPTDATAYPNIVTIDTAKVYDDNYMIKLINSINSKLANGDIETQLMTFNGPREIAARPELLGYLKTPKTGFILNSDISTKLFYTENFDLKEAERYGTQYRGNIVGYDMQEAPQGIWTLVEKWLNLAAGSLDKVHGIIFTPQAYAAGGVGKKEVKLLQDTSHDGVTAFPYIKYGGTGYRIMYIIAEEGWEVPTALQNTEHAARVVAPTEWYADGLEPINKVIYDADGNAVANQIVANVLKPNGNANCAVTVTVTGTGGAAVTNAVVSVTSDGKAIPVLNNTDGTYLFSVPRGKTASVTVNATGYAEGTATVSATNTKQDFYKTTVAITAG